MAKTMILCCERKFDQQNRLLVPLEYLRKAGGGPNCKCYVMFDEATKEIKIVVKECDGNEEICDSKAC